MNYNTSGNAASEGAEDYLTPDPLLPGMTSPAMLLAALDVVTIGNVPDITSDIAHVLCSLIGDAAARIGWESMARIAYQDAEVIRTGSAR